MRIADWPEDERPRERLLARARCRAELLAIFPRTGISERRSWRWDASSFDVSAA
jgi:DNA repair protein RadC